MSLDKGQQAVAPEGQTFRGQSALLRHVNLVRLPHTVFALPFALVGVVPGLLVYTVSLQFLAKSIESWFDVRVERALEGGLNLGRAALDVMLNELLLKAHVMALDLSETPRRDQAAALARLREQAYVEEAWLMTDGGQVLARASREPGKLVPPGASVQALRDARQVRGYAVVEPVGDKGLLLRVIVSLETSMRGEEPRLLQLTHWVPQTLAEQGESVQSVYRIDRRGRAYRGYWWRLLRSAPGDRRDR